MSKLEETINYSMFKIKDETIYPTNKFQIIIIMIQM